MNCLTLKSCVFNNFMSYGNTVNEFTFPNGLVWMRADNGCGKSTLVEAINFSLFGTSYRGGNKAELRNTRNTEGVTRVMLEFDCDRGNGDCKSYRVTRSITPKGTTKFEVDLFEGDHWVPMSRRAGLSQKDFEESILGFNEILFKNTIAMNTQETIPFLEMTAKQRRDLLESIIMVSWEPWKKETARRLSTNTSDFDIAKNDINRIGNEIANLTALCEQLRNEKKENVELLEAQLAQIVGTSAPAEERVQALQASCSAKKVEIDALIVQLNREAEVDAAIARIQAASTEIGMLARYREELVIATKQYEDTLAAYGKLGKEALEADYNRLSTEIDAKNSAIDGIRRESSGMLNSIHTAELELSSLEGQLQTIVAQGTSLQPLPLVKAGQPCPVCGKLTTEDDIKEQNAEIARKNAEIEKGKEDLRRKWTAVRNAITEKKAEIERMRACLPEYDSRIVAIDAERIEIETRRGGIASQIAEVTRFYNERVLGSRTAVDNLNASIAASERTIQFAGLDPSKFASELSALSAEKQKFPALRQQWNTLHGEMQTISQSLGTSQQEYVAICQNISRLENEIRTAKEKAATDSLSIAEKQLADANKELSDAQNRFHTSSDNILAYNYISQTLCSDSGVKKLIFSHFVPAFNKSVEKNLLRLGLPFSVSFNDEMDAVFHSSPGQAPSLTMLSQGQRRKLGFAISMAFRDFVSLVGNFKINFLSMDEVLDVSTDDTGMRDMLDIVRGMTEEIGCALVITHRGMIVADKFDYRIAVENDGNYSTLGELEKL